MKGSSLASGFAVAGCTLAVLVPPRAAGQVSEGDFKALKDLVRQQGEEMKRLSEEVQKLQQTHAADAQAHQKDVEQIQQLREKLGETQRRSTAAERDAAAAAETQPMPRVPIDEATVNHNFLILGDAELQYAKTQKQPGAFLLADFAPIFLYRAADNVLFEAGFDIALQNNAPGSSVATTSFDLSFAHLDYLINDYATAVGGNMLLPLGTYSERTAGWLNKFPDDPLPRDILPGSGVGVMLRGAVPATTATPSNGPARSASSRPT